MKWVKRSHLDISSLAMCRECLTPLKYIYDQSLRDFCHECETRYELEAYREAQRIIRNRGRK